MSDLGDWFKSLPLFTRYWLALTLGFSLLGRFGFLNPLHLALFYEPFIKKFQIWRIWTALFYYPITPQTGFHFMINCYFLYNYSLRLETGHFGGFPADYFFLLFFNWVCCVVISLMADLPLLMDPMVLSIVYIWCQLNKDTIVGFWFGSRFKAMYLPWVLLGVNMILSGGGLMELIGILVGHLYFFLMFKYPQEMGGPRLLSTPSVLYKWFPNQQTFATTFGTIPRAGFGVAAAGATNQHPGARRYDWGPGRALGSDN